MRLNRLTVVTLATLVVGAPQMTFAQERWEKPKPQVDRVLTAPLPLSDFISPSREWMIQCQARRFPTINELAQPTLRLAGVRINRRSRALQEQGRYNDFRIVRLSDNKEFPVSGLGSQLASAPAWSPDGKRFAVTVIEDEAVRLYVGDVESRQLKMVPQVALTQFFGAGWGWLPDSQHILLQAATPLPTKHLEQVEAQPAGPAVSQCSGGKATSTYEVRDVLKGPKDEEFFEAYATSQPTLLDLKTGKLTAVGKPAIYPSFTSSPDGRHFLVETIHRPYSYLTTHARFPREVEIWNTLGQLEKKVTSRPLADKVVSWSVVPGPRSYRWQWNAPATVVWCEAVDGGDTRKPANERDKIVSWTAPFAEQPQEIARLPQRLDDLYWIENDPRTLITMANPLTHLHWLAVQDGPGQPLRTLWERNYQDQFADPGELVGRRRPNGSYTVEHEGDFVYLSGRGANKDGEHPFLDRFNLKDGSRQRLFTSPNDRLESVLAFVGDKHDSVITRSESPTQPPNLFLKRLDGSGNAQDVSQLTHKVDPTPEVQGVKKRLVRYQRADGVDLSFTLYLPPNYQEGTRVPAILWAYPLDYSDAKAAANQVSSDAQRFTRLSDYKLALLDGYAVIDGATIPVIGDPQKMYDNYMEQLIAGAEAAVKKAVEIGVVDPDRLGVTGHSHGGLMTVNLLTHTDLFRAGVARSGAYNRTLTAFGFQSEQRSYWEAPDVYLKVSPFFHINKLNEPLLLIHGEQDANPGTVPLQSQALYEAIRGNGGTAKLVMLPYESHGYASLESNRQLIYEMLAWFDRYVKNAPPRTK